MARTICSFDRYFPVPTISRERSSRPAITSGSSITAGASIIVATYPLTPSLCRSPSDSVERIPDDSAPDPSTDPSVAQAPSGRQRLGDSMTIGGTNFGLVIDGLPGVREGGLCAVVAPGFNRGCTHP